MNMDDLFLNKEMLLSTDTFLNLGDEERDEEAIGHLEDADLLLEVDLLDMISSALPEEDIFDLLAIALLW